MPVKDIPFIKGQREKEGTISSYQIGLKDMPEHNRQVRAEKRKDTEKELAQKRQKKENDERKRQEDERWHLADKCLLILTVGAPGPTEPCPP